MPGSIRTSTVLAAIFCLCTLLSLLLSPLAVAQVYKITDLGTLAGGSSEAYGLNALGQVVGTSCVDSDCHAFLWTKAGGMQDLGTLPGGGSYSVATGVNELMQVAGSSDFAQPFRGDTHAFLWTTTAGMLDLGTLGCPDITGANGINSFGQIVGTSTIPPCPGGGQYRAFLWSKDSGMQDLGTLPGGSFSLANGINAFSWVVGYSGCSNCGGSHPFVWTTSGMQDLGTLPGGTFGAAIGVSDVGAVIGMSDSAISGADAFLWTARGGMHDLGTLPGGTWSSAYAVNDSGYVVGSADSPASRNHSFVLRKNGGASSNTSHAFIWTKRRGMLDLNHLIVPRHSGWVLQSAQGITLFGQIAGWGTFNGNTHAFLLTPLPFLRCLTTIQFCQIQSRHVPKCCAFELPSE
jgi:probable HAF family extracellular repeat protein